MVLERWDTAVQRRPRGIKDQSLRSFRPVIEFMRTSHSFACTGYWASPDQLLLAPASVFNRSSSWISLDRLSVPQGYPDHLFYMRVSQAPHCVFMGTIFWGLLKHSLTHSLTQTNKLVIRTN